MKDLRQLFEQIWHAYSGQVARQTVADLSRLHRIQASPGYRQAAQLLHRRLVREGVEAEILSYPADERTTFWTSPSFQEWEVTDATLHLVAPQEHAGRLADYRAAPISLIQRSTPFEGQAEVVLLEDGVEETDYEGLDVAGKVVLSRGDLRRVWELAVAQRGAAGILFDGMRPVPPVRPEGDLAGVRQYTSFWWQPGDAKCFGFVLTPRQGLALRRLLKGGGEPVRVQAKVVSRLYDGAMEVVSAVIPGEMDEEILIVAHLCHPQPSANDNASGAAAALEAARTLHSLITSGALARPRRTIRLLWMPEMAGTWAYLSGREADLQRLIAGLNLDMIGGDQAQTGSAWVMERPPDAAASFAPDLVARLRDELPALKGMADVSSGHSGMEAYPLYCQAEVTFSGGSDHYILSDPSVGVPTPMLTEWPDRYYHTAADTADRTDPDSMARAGSLAAVYAYWLATAGTEEATWLGYEMIARFKARVTAAAQRAMTEIMTLHDGQTIAQVMAGLDRQLAYLMDREKAALRTLEWLAPVHCLDITLLVEAERAANRGLAWASGAAELRAATLGLQALPQLPPRDLSSEEELAQGLIPLRQVRGPIRLQQHLGRLDEGDNDAWRKLLKARPGGAHGTLTTLALYWADGVRSVLDIADLVEFETGIRDVELVLTYFQLLGKLGFVTL